MALTAFMSDGLTNMSLQVWNPQHDPGFRPRNSEHLPLSLDYPV